VCSINGFNFKDETLVLKMNEATSHRGPDDTGVFINEEVSLGHNRLSIIDLSQKAHQPMLLENLAITFNGEIYNFKELRKELEDKYTFQSDSDTEVILAGYSLYKEAFIERLNGIFAFAIWDKAKNELFLARDHAGVKPLYYYLKDNKFIFSSEIKGILEHNIERKLNISAFNTYMRVLYVPEPMTMFENINKLPPGSYGLFKNGKLSITNYWNIKNNPKKVSSNTIKEKVITSVKRQLISDRPLGIYLSGGIDSSIILSSTKKFSNNIETFSVGFDLTESEQKEKFNKDFDLARKTAKFFGTKHNEIIVKPQDVWENFEKAVWHLDEPLSNPTIVPMFILSKFAKGKVAVVLSGDGGDELFGGYERYRLSLIQDYYQKLPFVLRKIFSFFNNFNKLNTKKFIDRFSLFMFQKDDLLQKVIKSDYFNKYPYEFFEKKYFKNKSKNFTNLFIKTDRKSWLVDEDLMRGDKMGMAHGLEVRVPFLDKDLIALAENMPISQKVSLFNKKIWLKKAFKSIIPKYLFSEPKRGWFSPGAKWLRYDSIKNEAQKVLSSSYYEPTSSLFNWEEISVIFEEHINNKKYNLTILWSIITFQIWAKKYKVEI